MPSGPSRRSTAREVHGQLAVPDGLQHLDRGDVREGALERAVVLQQDRDAVREPGVGHPLPRQVGLLLREGEAGHARAELARRVQREAAPAAADLQHVRIAAETQLLADAPVLGLLGLLERHLGPLEHRARVGPRRVEEQRVEVVAEVVVVLDVAFGARQVRSPGQPRAAALERGERGSREAVAGALGGDRERLHQGHQVVARPVAGGVRLAHGQAARAWPGGATGRARRRSAPRRARWPDRRRGAPCRRAGAPRCGRAPASAGPTWRRAARAG